MHGKGLPQSMPSAQDYYNRELAGGPREAKRVLKERGLWSERGLVLECPTTQSTRLQPRGWLLCTFGIRKDACRERLKQWATVFCFISSFIASSILLSATGAKQNGLQGEIVDMTLKHWQRCPKP